MGRGSTNRTLGHNAEREFCNKFIELGFEKCKTARYGSKLVDDCKIDLINLPINVQIKAGLQSNLNANKELVAMKELIKIHFMEDDPIQNKLCILIHRKKGKPGKKRTDEDDLVYISLGDAEKYSVDFSKIIKIKEYKKSKNMYFSKLVVLTFNSFVEQVLCNFITQQKKM